MSEAIQWQNNVIDVRARLVPRFLWTTASIDVYLNDKLILRTGGQMKFTGSCSAEFTHSGATHTVKLNWGLGGLRSFPYELRVDDIPVTDARVQVQNWPFGLVIWGGIVGLVFLALLFSRF